MTFNCEIPVFNSPHLNQVYEGLNLLDSKGVINANFVNSEGDTELPIIDIQVNDSIKVTYDLLDGINWFKGTVDENLNEFKNITDSDFYFKRSYSPVLQKFKPNNTNVYPLGLNYSFTPSNSKVQTFKQKIKRHASKVPLLNRAVSTPDLSYKDFEKLPIPKEKTKILFMTRLWDPDETDQPGWKKEWNELNNKRIEYIRICREKYGDNFLGGVRDDYFSRRVAPDLILPKNVTRKENYLDLVDKHNICISTTGLHGSVGWKIGEYVAMSKAIITEPLTYKLPGNFTKGENYLEFKNSNELVESIDKLLNNRVHLEHMMMQNYRYYLLSLHPETLVSRTFLIIKDEMTTS